MQDPGQKNLRSASQKLRYPNPRKLLSFLAGDKNCHRKKAQNCHFPPAPRETIGFFPGMARALPRFVP